MEHLLSVFNQYELALLVAMAIYGIAFGVRNCGVNLLALVSRRVSNQSDLGRILDSCFVVGTAYLSFVAWSAGGVV